MLLVHPHFPIPFRNGPILGPFPGHFPGFSALLPGYPEPAHRF